MGNYENLKQSITEVIRTNGNQEITGAVLQSTLLTIISTVGANATFAGIATPATNPGTPDGPVFYLASESGTYTNFNAIELQAELSVLMWNGSWSSQQIFSIDNEPTAGSDNLVKSGGVQEELALGAVYDVSSKNPTAGVNNDGKFESLSALLEDDNLNTLIPMSVRKGGMSIRFIQSSDNKYIQYILSKSVWSTNVDDWECIIGASDSANNADLDISDESGHVLVRFKNGHIQTKHFDSKNTEHFVDIDDSANNADLDISDELGNVLARFKNGHVQTKYFNSKNIVITKDNFVYVAASDSSNTAKSKAKYVCDGTNDVATINEAISQLNGNGKIVLANGHYYIDSFSALDNDYGAIVLRDNNTGTIVLEGEHDTYGFWHAVKVVFVVKESVYNALSNDNVYSIIRHNGININRHLVVNNISFNIYNNQKKIICIDALYSGGINVYNCHGFVTLHPATWGSVPSTWEIPNEDCVFFRGLSMSQNAYDVIRFCSAESMGVAFAVQGEHIELDNCGGICCMYAFTFNKYPSQSGGAYCHPMLLSNCLEEMCYNMPKFYDNTFRQSVRIINYHSEWKPEWFALGGKYAEETTPGQWYGFVNYELQSFGSSYLRQNSPSLPFWEGGNGKNVQAINDAHSLVTTSEDRIAYAPNYGQKVYDITINKLCICKDTNPVIWVDSNGQTI